MFQEYESEVDDEEDQEDTPKISEVIYNFSTLLLNFIWFQEYEPEVYDEVDQEDQAEYADSFIETTTAKTTVT